MVDGRWQYYKLAFRKVFRLGPFVFHLLFIAEIHAQDTDNQVIIYPFILDPERFEDLNFFKPILEQKNFFFLSEAHFHPKASEISSKFIRFFANSSRQVYVVFEGDFAHGCALNEYFQTGNYEFLMDFYEYQPDYITSDSSLFAQYKLLKDWSDSNKLNFEFVGIDVCKEGFEGSTYWLLKLMKELTNASYVDVIALGDKMLTSKIGYRDMSRWLNKIEKSQLQNDSPFGQDSYFKDSREFENIIHNVRQSLKIKSLRAVNREAQIADNFKRYIKPSDQVFSYFGYGHVLTNRWPDYGERGRSFVDWLEADSAYRDKSVIIGFSPSVNGSSEFSLFGKLLSESIKIELENTAYPKIVDFRRIPAINDQFQFAIIIGE